MKAKLFPEPPLRFPPQFPPTNEGCRFPALRDVAVPYSPPPCSLASPRSSRRPMPPGFGARGVRVWQTRAARARARNRPTGCCRAKDASVGRHRGDRVGGNLHKVRAQSLPPALLQHLGGRHEEFGVRVLLVTVVPRAIHQRLARKQRRNRHAPQAQDIGVSRGSCLACRRDGQGKRLLLPR